MAIAGSRNERRREGIVIGLGVFALLVGAMAKCGGGSSKYV
ncbi:MAG TPA: hypothetical protein VG327_12630 [Mycobacterium sp.]|nr:hypothetical protein [Mycobacterium sp.]